MNDRIEFYFMNKDDFGKSNPEFIYKCWCEKKTITASLFSNENDTSVKQKMLLKVRICTKLKEVLLNSNIDVTTINIKYNNAFYSIVSVNDIKKAGYMYIGCKGIL